MPLMVRHISGAMTRKGRFLVSTQGYRMSGGNGRGAPEMQQAARGYIERGLCVVPIPAREKNPGRRGWQDERWTVEDVPRLWTNGQNIGVLLGVPSGGMIDV